MRHAPSLDVRRRRAARERPAPRRGAGPGPGPRRGGRRPARDGVRRRAPTPTRSRARRDEAERRRTRVTVESGLVVVDKPAGITSHDVVARVRRLAGTRKVGHAGTLDPMATGVLVLGIDRATRLLGPPDAHRQGVRRHGPARRDHHHRRRRGRGGRDRAHRRRSPTTPCARSLAEFTGDLRPGADRGLGDQGRRQARLRSGSARARTSSCRPRRSRSTSWWCTTYGAPATPSTLDISVRCSSGTYVRAIARDVGARLDVGGHLTALRRTAVGPYGLAGARTLEQLADDFEVVPIADAARAAFPSWSSTTTRAAERPGRPPARPRARRPDGGVRTGRGVPRALRAATGRRAPSRCSW